MFLSCLWLSCSQYSRFSKCFLYSSKIWNEHSILLFLSIFDSVKCLIFSLNFLFNFPYFSSIVYIWFYLLCYFRPPDKVGGGGAFPPPIFSVIVLCQGCFPQNLLCVILQGIQNYFGTPKISLGSQYFDDSPASIFFYFVCYVFLSNFYSFYYYSILIIFSSVFLIAWYYFLDIAWKFSALPWCYFVLPLTIYHSFLELCLPLIFQLSAYVSICSYIFCIHIW